jgi:hypothetical protein
LRATYPKVASNICTIASSTNKDSPGRGCLWNLFDSRGFALLVLRLFRTTGTRPSAASAAEPKEVATRIAVEIEEIVGGLLQFPGGRAAERDDFHLTAVMNLQLFNERHEITVSCDKNDSIKAWGGGDGIDGEADVPVRLLGATVKDLEVLGAHLDADLGEGPLSVVTE